MAFSQEELSICPAFGTPRLVGMLRGIGRLLSPNLSESIGTLYFLDD